MRAIAIASVLVGLSAPVRADQLPNPDPMIYGEDPPPRPRAAQSRVPDYIAASLTAGFAAGAVVSVVKLFTLTDARRYDEVGVPHDYNRDPFRWQVAAVAFGGASVISGVITAFLFARHNAPAFDVNANGQSAVVTYSGRF